MRRRCGGALSGESSEEHARRVGAAKHAALDEHPVGDGGERGGDPVADAPTGEAIGVVVEGPAERIGGDGDAPEPDVLGGAIGARHGDLDGEPRVAHSRRPQPRSEGRQRRPRIRHGPRHRRVLGRHLNDRRGVSRPHALRNRRRHGDHEQQGEACEAPGAMGGKRDVHRRRGREEGERDVETPRHSPTYARHVSPASVCRYLFAPARSVAVRAAPCRPAQRFDAEGPQRPNCSVQPSWSLRRCARDHRRNRCSAASVKATAVAS